MKFLFHSLSYYLKEYPLSANMGLSSCVAFWGDLICQTVYEPASGLRPPLTREMLPVESANSILLVPVTSPRCFLRTKYAQYCGDENSPPVKEETILVDLRRSFIFSSFTFFFGVPFFLATYRQLDKIIPPHSITKRGAICKGFLSWIAAQITNPVFLTYVTAMDHLVIFREGRDGRRRVMEVESGSLCDTRSERPVRAGEGLHDPNSMFLFQWSGQRQRETRTLQTATDHRMGNHYRYVENTSFNLHEYTQCVWADSKRKLIHDFPDILRYGLVFWGANWLPMFYYIPSHFRLAYSSAVQVVWSGIMSHLLHRSAIGPSQ